MHSKEFQRIASRDEKAFLSDQCKDLTEAEDIKKRWQEYTEELYKKELHDPDNNDGVITHLRDRFPGMQGQVGFRKHHYEQS